MAHTRTHTWMFCTLAGHQAPASVHDWPQAADGWGVGRLWQV